MPDKSVFGKIIKDSKVFGKINKGVGMGELPQASGLSEFLSPAYSVNGTDLAAVQSAISEKSGVASPAFPDGFVEAVDGIREYQEPLRNMISGVLSLVPMFDETWATAKFTLASNHSGGKLSVPNPLGKIPSVIYVLKLDIDYSIIPQVIGGYNVGNITDDNDNNRTVRLAVSNYAQSAPRNLINCIEATNWAFANATTGAATAEAINIRSGGAAGQTLWLAGEYILAVK